MGKKVAFETDVNFVVTEYSVSLPESKKGEVEWAYKKEGGNIVYCKEQGFINNEGKVAKTLNFDKTLIDETITVMAYIPPQKPSEGASMQVEVQGKTIFLTFDDGIQPGTEEVLNILEETGVKATFFLTGINIKSFGVCYGDTKTTTVLNNIKSNHEIANHSYSHANNYYYQFYVEGGLKIGKNSSGSFERRTVLEDFQKNDELILGPGKQIKLARFPGRNTWKYPGIDDIDSDNDYDTTDEASQLHHNGYVIYGWDTEWKMSFDAVKESKRLVQRKADNGTIDWSNESDTHPYIDFYEHSDYDRLIDTPTNIFDKIEDAITHWFFEFDDSKKEDKVILLMHDRAFRGNDAQKLKVLIEKLKAEGYRFGIISEY